MNKQETAKLITVIKGFYPWSLTGMSEDATKLMICTWTKFFEDYDVVDVEKALMETVRTNLTSFPPSAGMIVSNIPERRTGIRDYNDPREKLEREEMTKALQRKAEYDKNRYKGDY